LKHSCLYFLFFPESVGNRFLSVRRLATDKVTKGLARQDRLFLRMLLFGRS
jgi:hypothetical protein